MRFVFARRGKAVRNAALSAALGRARDRFNTKWGTTHRPRRRPRLTVPHRVCAGHDHRRTAVPEGGEIAVYSRFWLAIQMAFDLAQARKDEHKIKVKRVAA